MWQTLTIVIVVFVALLFIGKRVYRQFQQALDPSQKISCGSGCCDCNETGCDNKDTPTSKK